MRRGCDGERGLTASYPSPRDGEQLPPRGLSTPEALPGLPGISSVVKRSTLGSATLIATNQESEG